MKSMLLAGAALATLLVAPAAFAQGDDDWSAWTPGWYGAVDAGGHHTNEFRGTFPGSGIGLNPVFDNPDWVAFARIGYRLNGHIRLEAEGGYRHETLKSFNGFDPGNDADRYYLCKAGSTGSGDCTNPAGSETAWSAMGNVLFDLLPHSRINPFIGGGAGVIGVKLHSGGLIVGGPPVTPAVTPFVAVVDSSETHFAYQGIAGISFRATDRVNVDLTYHYTRADNISVRR